MEFAGCSQRHRKPCSPDDTRPVVLKAMLSHTKDAARRLLAPDFTQHFMHGVRSRACMRQAIADAYPVELRLDSIGRMAADDADDGAPRSHDREPLLD
jgi:hypothetical protein